MLEIPPALLSHAPEALCDLKNQAKAGADALVSDLLLGFHYHKGYRLRKQPGLL